MKNNRKKVLLKQMKTVLLVCLLMIGTIFAWNISTEHVYAAEPTKVDDYLVKQYSDITEYRQKDNLKIPEAYDDNKAESGKWLFAGWYTNNACTSSLSSGSVCTGNKTMTGTYYAKFVSADVLSVKCQITKDTLSTSDSTKLRCVSSVDSLKYKKIGFELITPEGKTKYMESNKVGTRINATTTENAYSFSPKVVDTESEYFFSAIETIEKDNFDKGYIVQPYWITKDGTKVYGVNKYVTVMEGITDQTNTTIHVPVKMDAEPTGTFQVEGGNATAVSCAEYQSGYAHFAITVSDRNALNSATKFVIKEDGTEIATYIYRNLTTQYDGTDAKKDDSWYSVYSAADTSEDEFIIATSADLYGFAKAVTSSNKFDNKKVYLVNDIEANKGYADKVNLTWNSSLAADGITSITGTNHPWTAIGSTSNAFNGVFDGQMHTISGLYLSTSSSYQGMFSATGAKAEIRNFYLKNSYFSAAGGIQHGSVVGNAKGTFDTIYSDAIMLGSGGQQVGGILGATSTQDSVAVSNCWFAGSVISNAKASYFGGLIGRVANATTITNCLNTGTISHNENPGTEAVGGLVGYIEQKSLTISNSVNTSEITTADSNAQRGLIVGYYNSTNNPTISITNSHSFNQSDLTVFVHNKDNSLYQSTCGRYSLSEVASLNSLTQGKIGKLFTADTAKGYWSVTKDGFPALTSFERGSNVISQAVDTSWYDESKKEFTLKSSGDLYGFALLSQTNTFDDATIKLGADIEVNKGKAIATGWDSSQDVNGSTITNGTDFLWMPIGTTSYPFNGKFDGQMHTISGIYLNATSVRNGMFSATDAKAEIKNFYLKNSYFTSTDDKLGSIVGEAKGTFETIYSDAIVAGYGSCDQVGGMIGVTHNDGGVTMSDCWFAGSSTINSAASYLGGLIGYVSESSVITNCLNTGEVFHKFGVTTAATGGFVGNAVADISISYSVNKSDIKYTRGSGIGLFIGAASGSVTLTNSHSLDTSDGLVNGSNSYSTCTTQNSPDVAGIKALTTAEVDQLFLAEAARGYWSITTDGLPVLSSFEEGSGVIAQAVDTSWYDESKNEYTLMDSGDLYGFALLSQTNTFEGKDIKLGDNITINKDMENPDFEWMSIGKSANKFQGDFDGQMHTISGLYQNSGNQLQGLFGDIVGDVLITNFSLIDSYFNYNGSNDNAFMGAVAGRATGQFENIYVNASVESTGKRTAGLIGSTSTSGTLTIVNCWNAGQVSSKNAYIGSLIGYVDKAPTIKNCLNTGAITTTYTDDDATENFALNIGGVLGNSVAGTGLYNCLNIGAVNYVKTDYTTGYGMMVGTVGGSTTFKDLFTIQQEGTGDYNNGTTYSDNVTKIASLDGIKGTDALTNMKNLFTLQTTDGKYDSYWSVVANGAPVLTSFAKYTGTKSIAVDTNWYDSSTNEYTLMDSGDLYGLAILSYKTNFESKTIKLGDDIKINEGNSVDWNTNTPDFGWLSIGDSTSKFKGNFDGQMHIISGIYQDTTAQCQGFFGDITGDVLFTNFSLINSYFCRPSGHGTAFFGAVAGRASGRFENIYVNATVESSGQRTAGFVGSTGGALTMINCWNAGSVSNTSACTAGLIGIVDKNVTIKNCLNTGAISTSYQENEKYVGGLIGQIYNSDNITINLDNCLNTGTIEFVSGDSVSKYGMIAGNVTSKTYFNAVYTVKQDDIPPYDGTTRTDLTFDLDDIKGSDAFRNMPDLFASSDADGVYDNDWVCVEDGTPVLATFAKYAGTTTTFPIDVTWYNEDSYQLVDTSDLYGFVALSRNKKVEGFSGKTITLGNDITLNEGEDNASTWAETEPENEWIGIGRSSKPFVGTFDGQGNTISGLYMNTDKERAGLFAAVGSTGTVQNIRLENSYIESTAQKVGSIAGQGEGTFKNIYSKTIVKNDKGIIGGLIGYSTGEDVLLEKCWFAGTVTNTAVDTQAGDFRGTGGLVGTVNNTSTGELTLRNCLNSGTVDVSAYNESIVVAGGFIGWIQNQTDVEIDGCFMSGTMNGNDSITMCFGPIAGSVRLKQTVEDEEVVQSTISISRTYAVDDIVNKSETNVSDDSFVYVNKNEINGDAAKDMMPLLGWDSDWQCVEGDLPVINFSSTEEKEDLTATLDDETQLTRLYVGRKLYQGELHDHADTGGNSDGTVALTEWLNVLNSEDPTINLGIDFAASLDHKQADHIDLEAWDVSKLIYGSEASSMVYRIGSTSQSNEFHYNMLFKSRADFEKVLNSTEFANDFEYANGKFEYPGKKALISVLTSPLTREKFTNLITTVQEADGFFVLPHPLNYEDNAGGIDEYYFTDGIGIEVLYTPNGTDEVTKNAMHKKMYDGWVELLADGHKMFACAGSDSHNTLNNQALTSIYAKVLDNHELCTTDEAKKACLSTECNKGNMIETLVQGNFVAGSAGIKMSVGTMAMGGTCDFTNQRVVVDVDKIHTLANDLNHKYRLDVINEHGVVYSKKLTVDSNGLASGIELAFNADEESKFYRVVVYDATTKQRIAIGNPIWND